MLTKQATASRRAKRHLGHLMLAGILILAGPAEPAHADETVPGAPQLSASYSSGTDTVTFEWKAPASDGGSAITGYLAEYLRSGDPAWTDVRLGPTATELTLTQTSLVYSQRYRLRLAAVNAVGQSAWSTITFNSLDKPDSPTIESVLVRHQALDIRVYRGFEPIMSTTVIVNPGGHKCILEPYQTMCSLSGLTGNTKNTITAYSVNPVGVSAAVTATAIPVGNPTAVRNLKAKVVKKNGKRRIVLTWTKPANLRSGVLTGITVRDLVHQTTKTYAWRTSLTITSVKKRKYTFVLTPYTRAAEDPGYHIYGPSKTINITVH